MPTSDIFTGQNDTNLLASEQDTAQSANDIFKNNPKTFNNPEDIVHPEAPKGLYGTVNPGEDINLDKTSYEYNANLYDRMSQSVTNQYKDSATRLPDINVPQSETNRFTGNDYGFDITRNNEGFYANHQGIFKMGANAVANLVTKTAAYALQNTGLLVGAPIAAVTGNVSNMTDNFLTRAGDYLKEGVESKFPIYKSDKYTQGNIWQKLGTAGWWLDDAIDRVALTAAMFIPGLAESKGIGLANLGEKALMGMAESPENYGWLGKTFSSKLYKAATEGVADAGVNPALNNYAKSLTKAELFSWNVIGQSGLNAKETQEAVLKATGDKDKAAAAAVKSFWETVPLSFLGSLAEIPQMFSSVNTAKSLLNKVFDKDSGELLEGAFQIKPKSTATTIRNALLTGFEHGQNESMQVAVSRFNEETAEGKEKRNTIPGIWGDFINNIHDPNGQNNIALGTIQGILMTLGGKVFGQDKAKDKDEMANRQSVFNIINQAKLSRRFYNGDFAERDENGKIKVNEKGNVIQDQNKIANVGLSLIGMQNASDMKMQAIKNNDYLGASIIDHKALAGFAYDFFSDPNGMEHLENILKLEAKVSEVNPDRKNDVDENGNEITPARQLQRNLDTIRNLKKMYDAIDQRHAGFFDLGIDKKDKAKVSQGNNFIESLKAAQYTEASNQLFLNRQIERNRSSINAGGINEETTIDEPSNPLEERHNQLVEENKHLFNALDESKERYKALVDKKAQRQAFNEATAVHEEAEKRADETKEKQETQKTEDVQAEISNPKPPTPEQIGDTQSPAPVSTTTTPDKPEEGPGNKLTATRQLYDQKQIDLANAKTQEEKDAINKKYLKDVLALNKVEDAKAITPESQDKRFQEIKDMIPKGKTIDTNEHTKISELILSESLKGSIDAIHEGALLDALDSKKITGTIFDDGKDIEDEESDNPEETTEEKPGLGEQDVKDSTETPTEDDSSLGKISEEYNPNTEDVQDEVSDSDMFNFIAWRSSNKTITQEELQNESGRYTNALDEDPYKQFKQGYLRHLNEVGMPDNGIQAKLVRDSDEYPHSEQTKKDLSNGTPYGSILVISDMDRNTLYFDENYNSSTEKKEGSQPLVYSFNRMAWGKNENFRAIIGENRTGISADSFMQMYKEQQEQQDLARKLNEQGKEVYVDIKAISPGVINKSKESIKASTLVTPDMKPSLYIPPTPIDKFDPENPLKNRFVLVGNQALVNGALYANVTDSKTNIISYVRLLPNRIPEIPQLFEDLKTLLTHEFTDENEANIARDYIKEVLFLGRAKRPAVIIIDTGKGVGIRIMKDNVMMEPEEALTFLEFQRPNILRTNVTSNEYPELSIINGALSYDVKPNYTNFILENSTTKSLPIKTSEGSKYLALNSYAMFDFLDSKESMQKELANKSETPVGERPLKFDFNTEIPVFRHGENDEDANNITSGNNDIPLNEQGIKEAEYLGRRWKEMGIKYVIHSPILRAKQTAEIAAKVAGIPKENIKENKDLRTWDIGISRPRDQFDEAWFMNNQHETVYNNVKLGETAYSFINRQIKAQREIAQSAEPYTAIVAHSRDIRVWDAMKENNGLWNDNAIQRYLDLPSRFAFTSFNIDKTKKDNTTLTKNPLRKLARFEDSETEAQRLAREQDEKGLQAKEDLRENRDEVHESEIQKVNRIFGEQVAQRVYDIVNSDARALWTTSGIKLYRDAKRGDGFHEAWHHFSQLYLTQKEKKSLYNEVRRRAINFTDRDNNKVNTKDATDLQVEEFMADDFRDYSEKDGASRITDRPTRNNIFRKILDFIKQFFFGTINIRKLYDDLYQGNLNSYKPSVNNAFWGKLNSAANNQKGEEIFDNQKAAYFRGVVDYFMGTQLLKFNTSVDAIRRNRKLAEAIYKNIYNDILDNHLNPLLEKADKGESIDQGLAEDLYNMLSNWEDFVQYHKRASKLSLNIKNALTIDVPDEPEDYTDSTEIGDENDTIVEQEQEMYDDSDEEKELINSDKIFDLAGNEKSSFESASQETRSLIRMLPAVDYNGGKFTIKMDKNGFPQLNDYAKTWNNISFELSDLSDYGEMVKKVNDPNVQKKIPELSILSKFLPDPNKNTHTASEMNTVLAFRTDFNRAYIGIYSGRISDGRYYLNEETKRNKEQVKRLWTNNFYNKLSTDPNVTSERVLLDNENGKYYLNPQIPLNYNLANPAGRDNFMNLIGFSFSDTSREQSFFKTNLSQYLVNIQSNINQRHQMGYKIYNPVYDLGIDVKDQETRSVVIPGLRNTIEGLLYFESLNSSDVPSLSYQTAEGQMIHGLSLNHTLSITSNLLNKSLSYQDIIDNPATQHLNFNNNPNVRGSIFMNLLFNLNSNKRLNNNIVVGNYNGLKMTDKDGATVGYSTTSLNVRQKAVFDINSLLSSGSVEVMRTESSKSAYFIKLDKYFGASDTDKSRAYLPVGISEFTTSFNSPKFKSIMIDNYLYDELHRMKTAQSVPVFQKDADLMKAAEGFNLFRDILTGKGANQETLKNAIKESIKTFEVDSVIRKYRSKIEDTIQDYFEDELKRFKDGLKEENITEEDLGSNLPKSNMDQKLRAFLANDFILNVEYTKVFNGDTIYQAHYKDYFKRSKGDVSTGKTPMTDSMFAQYMKQRENNTFTGFISPTTINNYKTTKTINFSDDVRASKYIDTYRKDLKAVNSKLTDEQIEKKIKNYGKLTIGDGQGWITLDFYRQFLKSVNNWSPDQDRMYHIELAKWRLAHADFNTQYTNEQKANDRSFLKENKDFVSYFPPIKMQYNGPIKAIGTAPMVMDKFSVAPLLPSVVQGTPLEDIHNQMLKHGVGYAKFISGTKKYKAPATDMYTKEGHKTVDLAKSDLSEHYLEYLKEQINTNPGIKTESIFGSQVRKLIEANIFSSGVASVEDLARHNLYKSYIQGIRDLGKAELFKELSIGENEAGQMIIKDVQKFIATLQDQADLRDLNNNIKEYVQYDKDTNKMKYPLETSLNRRAIQDLIMGVIDNRLRIQKLSGDQLIQISSSGFQSNDFKYTNATEDEIKKYGTNGLRFYHLEYDKDGKPIKTISAQVKVGLNGGFEKLLFKMHSDGKKIGTIERLNELLKDEKWNNENKESIRLVGYRIPTQGHNSIEHLEVAEFLPPHVGSSVIVPAEIVAKAGSDFDIDKLSIFRPSFDDNGEITRGESKEGYSNKIIKLFSEILEDPKTFEKLITPNDTDLIKGEINDIAVAIGKRSQSDITDPKPYSGTQIYRYKNSLRKFESLLSAKRLLSIFAVNNTFTTLMQQAGTTMNMMYGLTNGPTRNVRLFLLSPDERKKVITKDGRLDLGNKYDVEGNLKQDYLNQLINATVDAASDDFFGYVNASYENVNIICNLINQGVPFNRAMWFLNQPVLLRYYSDLRRRSTNDSKAKIQARLLGEMTNTSFFYADEDTGIEKLDYKAFNAKVGSIINIDYTKLAVLEKKVKGNFANSKDKEEYARLKRNNEIYISLDALKKTTQKSYKVDEFLGRDNAKTYNALIFSYFLSLTEQGQLFRNFQTNLNFDTTKVSSPLASWQSWRSIEGLKANRLFDANEVKKLQEKSVIAPFNNKQLIATIGARLMPAAFNPAFMTQAVSVIDNQTKFKGKAFQKKFINNYENQWIEYIAKTMAKVDNYSLQSYAKYLLEGRNNLARKFNDLISKFPELKEDYALVNRLRPNFPNRDNVKKSNLEVYRLFENSTDDQNRYITEFRNLINLDDSKYDADQSKEIREFFRDLAILGFVQSGFSKSNISFQELVPYEELADMFKTAIQNMVRYISPDSKLFDEYMQEYNKQFNNNNGIRVIQAWRGRDYFLDKNIADAISKKTGKENKMKYQINTEAQPQPFENTVKPQTKPETKITPDQQKILDSFNQQKLLTPEVKTDRQYWPGEEVPDDADELTKALGKAEFKSMSDNVDKKIIDYVFIDLNIDPKSIKVDEEDDWRTLTSQNLEQALKIHNKFDPEDHDDLFSDDDGDVMGLQKLKQILKTFELENENGSTTEYRNGIKGLFNDYRFNNLRENQITAAENYLSQYGLLRYRDFNPNQLRLPFSGVDEETYNKQINQILKDKDKGC